MKRILFLISEERYFYTHRFNLAKAAAQAGFDVAITTKGNQYTAEFRAAGITVFPLSHFDRASMNPLRQVSLIKELYQVYKIYRPHIAHHVAMKPVLFGSFIAAFFKTPKIINAFPGLGYLFTDLNQKKMRLKKRMIRWCICRLFQWIFFKLNATLIVQNEDDLKLLTAFRCINVDKTTLIRGAGIDTKAFPLSPFLPEPPIAITCVARLLWDKGIGELVEAIKLLLEKKYPIKLKLYGAIDPENPSAISIQQIEQWQTMGLLEWRDHTPDIATVYQQCHIAVLASYREGLPKSLLEAASTGRPIVTTDAPGCREVVQHGVNGFCVPVKDSLALSKALITLIEDPILRETMGIAGRHRMEEYFKDSLIHQQTLALYAD
jgi:glycosyltransferase involved in cell wall biosynthesis